MMNNGCNMGVTSYVLIFMMIIFSLVYFGYYLINGPFNPFVGYLIGCGILSFITIKTYKYCNTIINSTVSPVGLINVSLLCFNLLVCFGMMLGYMSL